MMIPNLVKSNSRCKIIKNVFSPISVSRRDPSPITVRQSVTFRQTMEIHDEYKPVKFNADANLVSPETMEEFELKKNDFKNGSIPKYDHVKSNKKLAKFSQ